MKPLPADRARAAAARRTGVRPELWELVSQTRTKVNGDPFERSGRSVTLPLVAADKVVLTDGVRTVTLSVAERFVRLDAYDGPAPDAGVGL